MTREEFENEVYKAIDDLQTYAEAIESAANVYYDTDDDLDDVINQAEVDFENMESRMQEFKEKIYELKELKRSESDVEDDEDYN